MNDVECTEMTFWEVRKWLWESREREITHMWHRGAFLATFIVGTYTWYVKSLSANGPYCDIGQMAISVVCIAWSLLWIAMAKGASAWYELYEKAIKDLTTEYFRENATGVNKLLVGIVGEKCPIVGCHAPLEMSKWNNMYFSGAGGTFSLPRLNVAIGHLLLIVSSVLYCIHMVSFIASHISIRVSLISADDVVVVSVLVFANVVLLVGWWIYSHYFLRSDSLTCDSVNYCL